MCPDRRRCAVPPRRRPPPSRCGPCRAGTCTPPARERRIQRQRLLPAGPRRRRRAQARRSRPSRRRPGSRDPPWVVQHACHQQSDVDVGRRDRSQTCPCPAVMTDVEDRDASPKAESRPRCGRAREAVEVATRQVAEGVAAERVCRQKPHVDEHQYAPEANAEVPGEVEGDDCVVHEKEDLDECRIESEPVKVVEDPRESGFAAVTGPVWFVHGARTRMPQKGSEVSLAVVVAGEPEGKRRPRDPDRGRNRTELDQGRVKGAEIGSEVSGGLEEDSPGCEDDEQAKHANDEGWVEPVRELAVWVPPRSCMLSERHGEALSNYFGKENNSGGSNPPELAVRMRCHAGVVAAFRATLTVTRLRAVTNSKTMAPRTTRAASIRPNAA